MALVGAVASSEAAVVNQIGVYEDWPSEWHALPGLNDPTDPQTGEAYDFVGDSTDPAAFFATNDNYVFFRMRVAADSATSIGGAHHVFIDNNNDLKPDFGFAWDSKSNDPDAHGLEMTTLGTYNAYWNGLKMDDFDGNAAKKTEVDINGNRRTTDGYVRTVDGQQTTNFGQTTFIDIAVSWTYLATYPQLLPGTWNIAMGSVANATDHNAITADVAGGINPEDLSNLGWVVVGIPEPRMTALVIAIACIAAPLSRRIQSRRRPRR